MDCERSREDLVLLLYGEIDDPVRRDLEAHLEACPGCRSALAGERRLLALLAERPPAEPSAALLSRCREDLSRAIRSGAAATAPWWRRLRPAFRLSPAYGLAFLAAGFLAGWLAAAAGVAPAPGPQGGAASDAAVDPDSVVAGLRSVQVDDTGRVVLGYDARRSGSIEGPATDPRIRALLADAVVRSPHAGLRLEAIDALRDRVDDPDVRAALLRALQDDANPGVRLRALAALDRRTGADPQVRDALVDALQRDANAGVRVRAIDALARAGDLGTLPVMERLSRQGGDPYVRLRSGAFVEAMYAKETR